jgi:hypothetical protein
MGARSAAQRQAGSVAQAMTHDELILNAALARVNKSIARYISRVLDVDQGRTEYTQPLGDVQRELADELAEVEALLRDVIDNAESSDDPPRPQIVMGQCGPPIWLNRPAES